TTARRSRSPGPASGSSARPIRTGTAITATSRCCCVTSRSTALWTSRRRTWLRSLGNSSVISRTRSPGTPRRPPSDRLLPVRLRAPRPALQEILQAARVCEGAARALHPRPQQAHRERPLSVVLQRAALVYADAGPQAVPLVPHCDVERTRPRTSAGRACPPHQRRLHGRPAREP